MFGIVTIAGRDIEMLSNGATPYRFKQVFKTDLLKFFSDALNEKADDGQAADVAMKLGFIMAMQANKVDMAKLNEESFIEWMENFEANDLILSADKIMGLYNGSSDTSSISKKNPDEA